MNNETPTISSGSYSATNWNAANLLGAAAGNVYGNDPFQAGKAAAMQQFIGKQLVPQVAPIKQPEKKVTARIVKVFIADPNDNLPLDKRVLYSGDEKLTDLTDQELFFEVSIAEVLAKHNEVRAKSVDKKQAEKFGRDIFLEPARIRDLKMVVVTVAEF